MRRLAIVVVVLAGCGGASGSARRGAPAPEPKRPAGIFAGAGAGRYALSSSWSAYSSCSQSWDLTQVRASLVLELAPDGEAEACRGADRRSVGPGYDHHVKEQQGFRGRWRRVGPWIDIDLALANDVCPQRRAYLNIEPMPWRLRCAEIRPGPGSALREPVLGCWFAERVYTEEIGYELRDWVYLGTGNGVRVRVEYGDMGEREEITPSDRPIGHDEWTKPF